MTRKEANMAILRLINNEIQQFPDERFGQVLRNLGVIDDYYDQDTGTMAWRNGSFEEPQITYERMLAHAKRRAVK